MDVVGRAWTLAGMLAVMGAVAACSSRVEGHCGNNGGDAACSDPAPYCSLCTLVDGGCMAAVPSVACRPAPDEAASSDSGGGSSSSAGEGECTAVAALDASCPVQAPYCAAGTCQGCGALEDGFCTALDAAMPICDPPSGRCVECTAAAPSCDATTPFCAPDLVCHGCWKHEQCPDSACDRATGTCMPAAAVVWVDGRACPGPGSGTELDPFCEIRSALLLPVDVLTVRLRAGSIYGEQLSVGQARTIAVRGEGGRPRLSADSYVVNASNGARLLLAGIDVHDGDPAINCSGAQLWLEDVLVQPSPGDGIFANNCELHIHRSQIIDRDGYAIELRGRSNLDLHSSILGLNGTPDAPTHAIHVRDESMATVVYSTLAGNRGSEPSASLACEATAGAELRNSIAVSFSGDSIDCPRLVAVRNVVDVPLDGESNVEVAAISPTWFVDVPGGDFHLADPAQTPFGELGVWQGGDPYEDVDGEPRGPAEPSSSVVGADAP